MTRYIATVEHDAGEYWIRFPGIEKASEPIAPFQSVRLVVFEWDPPARTGLRVCGYVHEKLVLEVPVPAEKIALALALAKVPDTDPELHGGYPLTEEQANQIVSVPPGFTYVLEADR